MPLRPVERKNARKAERQAVRPPGFLRGTMIADARATRQDSRSDAKNLSVGNQTGYHETVTLAWIAVISRGRSFQETLRELTMDKVNIQEKLAQFDEHWSPKIVGELNGQLVKLVKFQGEFVWHHHQNEDELFLVVKGRFRMDFRDSQLWLGEGDFLVVPRGVEHRPVALAEAHVLLFEPAATLNTGNVVSERTIHEPQRI
jgi:mannose-6-phosphate isomerase-like protein (cupin superfamily)